MKIRVHPEKCTGHAQCWLAAPELYELDDEGMNVTGEVQVPPEHESTGRRGADACPEQAIEIL
ncbi:ferredoxin [Rhodococcus rhodochrous]|uniref:ferredoxin n=1 Tax=Rhodococcus rhodochrous TaxID=1829 RepID=UPI001E645369|nr:ferredoxin [Rhodococcus rhodochrous]MCB8913433.1 ferredoxin [Rhodococcus rhodochrous]